MGHMRAQDKSPMPYVTRFAPSPTGPLHFGSLTTALGGFLRARSQSGTWLIRIEDIDPPREVAGAAQAQIETLKAFGLISQGPIVYQSHRKATHHALIDRLKCAGKAYPCGCTNKDLQGAKRYPGTCRLGLPAGKQERSIRLKTYPQDIEFYDLLQGQQRQCPHRDVGDFVIRRGDGLVAYQLAVVADDHAQAITEVVRGHDLMSSVGRQWLVYEAIGAPPPAYLHLPVVVDANGRKLSKSDGADPIMRHGTAECFRLALRALGHEPPSGCLSLSAQWTWALGHWSVEAIPPGPVSL